MKFTIAYLVFIYLFGIALALGLREAINPFPDLPKLKFGSEDVIIILSILLNFNEISKVM